MKQILYPTLSLLLLTLSACSTKSYCLEIGDNGNAHVEAGIMQTELVTGSLTGPVTYYSVPKDVTHNPCTMTMDHDGHHTTHPVDIE